MRRGVVVLVVFLALLSSTIASQPGQPLDCSDFVIDEPGFTCLKIRDCGVEPTTGNPDFPCMVGGGVTADAEERLVGAEHLEPLLVNCGSGVVKPGRLEIKASDGISERVIAHADGRCGPGGEGSFELVMARSVTFDASSGRLFVSLESVCRNAPRCEYDSVYWLASFEGFTTLFDVLDSFTPSSADFGFRVPVRPDGLRGTDRFDTYWGTVSRPLDLSQAHPLQCAYPDHQPQVGEFLTYPDAAPTPAPGQAIYYLTSVTYQGQIRAGRQALDGRLFGRDATALPACIVKH